jgi:hypothetical protein
LPRKPGDINLYEDNPAQIANASRALLLDLRLYEKPPLSIDPGDTHGPRPVPAVNSSYGTSPGAACATSVYLGR